MAVDYASLPSWALEVMLACARGVQDASRIAAIEAERNNRLFEETADTVWHAQYPQYTRRKANDLTPPESWIPVSRQMLGTLFGEGGALAQHFTRYEPRRGQQTMAAQVAEALNRQRFLLAEAGTGVGKSLAYLVPCALWAAQNRLPIILSTNTRNLQSQLFTKDYPLVKAILKRSLPSDTELTAVVLKGRANYLCLKRFGAFVEGGFERLKESEALAFADLTAWASQTEDGDLDSFVPDSPRTDAAFIRSFGCRADECTGKRCRFYRRCFLQKARQAAQGAHLIIANHALVFAELSSPGSLLPPHAQIVFDEAHHLENAATGFLSQSLSPFALYDLCQKIAPSHGREAGSVFKQTQTDFIDKAVRDDAERVQLLALLSEIRQDGQALAKAGRDLFDLLFGFLRATPDATVRYRCVPVAGQPAGTAQPLLRREVCLTKSIFTPAEPLVPEDRIRAAQDTVNTVVTDVCKRLERLQAAVMQKAPPPGQDNPYEDLLASIEGLAGGLDAFAETLAAILDGNDPQRVYWMERTSQNENTVSLTSAPLDIARQLNKLLYESKHSLIFSSATLRIRNDFQHIRRRLGLNLITPAERVMEFVAESPFNYPAQCAVMVADYLPDGFGEGYNLELSRLMYRLFVAAKGRSIALFTSYDMLRACAAILEPHLKAKGIDLLVQTSSLGRTALMESFRAQKRPSVLFGTQSFWEGVDVVGDNLSCVVIARLPFETFGDPLFQSRCEKIDREGGSSFMELSVPQAVIRFRQGFGRLIRSRSDRGLVVVADSRIVRKHYGRAFAETLPVRIEAAATPLAIVNRLTRLLADQPQDGGTP